MNIKPVQRRRFISVGTAFTALGFLKGKKKLVLILAVALAIVGAVGYHFFKISSLQSGISGYKDEISTLREDLATSQNNERKLLVAVDEQKQLINRLKEQRQVDIRKLKELGSQYANTKKHVNELRKKLSDHNIAYLALNKPALIEKIINEGTFKVAKEIERLSRHENTSD